MKIPWKYEVITAARFDHLHFHYKDQAAYYPRPSNYYGNDMGGSFYGSGVARARSVHRPIWARAGALFHWTRRIPCTDLVPGQDIVDCLVATCDVNGHFTWLVGKHYVGMCPLKNKWKLPFKLRKLTLNLGRD